jgi:uncharacterized membrane protein YfcA
MLINGTRMAALFAIAIALSVIAAVGIVNSAIGSFIGRKIVGKINQTTFKKIVLASILLVSIKFIIDGSSSILK